MIQAVQARSFAVGNSLAHTKSCCQKIKEVFQKAWEAFKRAIDALMRPCVRFSHNSKIKRDYRIQHAGFEYLQRGAQGLPAEQLTRGFLFELIDNAGISKGYIFGSIHKIPSSQHHWHDSILEKFQQSTHLGVEQIFYDYDVGERVSDAYREANDRFFNDPVLDQNIVAHAAMQAKLASIQLGNVTPREIEQHDLAVQRETRDLPENEATKTKNRISLQFYHDKLVLRREIVYPGADRRLVAAAMQQNKPIIPLENEAIRNEHPKFTTAENYRWLFGKNVEELIRDRASTIQYLDRSLDAWKRGDYAAFSRIYEQNEAEKLQRIRDPVLLDLRHRANDSLRARNINTADTINQFIHGRGKIMAVFGIDHLPGQTGVIELMRQRGWTVQQVGEPIQVAEEPIQERAV